MDRYPRISRPCPVADRLGDVMDGDFCRQCRKQVIDLDKLGDADRFRTLAAAREELCVSYRRPVAAAALVAATLVARVAALPAVAQEAPPIQAATADSSTDEIIVGGAPILTKAQRARYEREARKAERQEKAAARRAERAARSSEAETH